MLCSAHQADERQKAVVRAPIFRDSIWRKAGTCKLVAQGFSSSILSPSLAQLMLNCLLNVEIGHMQKGKALNNLLVIVGWALVFAVLVFAAAQVKL